MELRPGLNDIKTAAEQDDIGAILADDRPRVGRQPARLAPCRAPSPLPGSPQSTSETTFSWRRARPLLRRGGSGAAISCTIVPARQPALFEDTEARRGAPQPPSLCRAFVLYELPPQRLVGLLLKYEDGSDGIDCARERLLARRGLALRRYEDVHGRRTGGQLRYEASTEAITAPAIAALLDPALSDHEHGGGVTISWLVGPADAIRKR